VRRCGGSSRLVLQVVAAAEDAGLTDVGEGVLEAGGVVLGHVEAAGADVADDVAGGADGVVEVGGDQRATWRASCSDFFGRFM
jgi:hypothetical protein